MTTTGGPDQSLAGRANGQTSPDDPVMIDGAAPEAGQLDGDDIVVEPAAPQSHPRRARRLAVGAIVAVVLVGALAIAVAALHHSDTTSSSNLRSVAPVRPPAARPKPHVVKPRTPVKAPRPASPAPPTPPAPADKSTPVSAAPPAVAPTPPVARPAPVPTPAPVTTPPVEPTSVLRWSATPAALSLVGGEHMSVTVTVVNPTRGTVTLGTPLSCAPTVRGPHGAVIGQKMCEQMAQVMSPHSKLSQRYTIYATDTADVSGSPLPPGVYTASVENLFKFKVNVTSS